MWIPVINYAAWLVVGMLVKHQKDCTHNVEHLMLSFQCKNIHVWILYKYKHAKLQ